MTQDEWKLLAETLDRVRCRGERTPQTLEVLEALKEVAWGMWANLNTKP